MEPSDANNSTLKDCGVELVHVSGLKSFIDQRIIPDLGGHSSFVGVVHLFGS